jgi:hypothetical protein
MGTAWFQVALADLNNGLVAYYPFDGNANDASSNSNHGTVDGATLTEDRFGNTSSAYGFDGVDDYIKINKNALFDVSSLTISAWVKWEGGTPTDHHAIVSNYSGRLDDSDELQHYGLRIAKQSAFSHFFYDDGSQWDDVEGISNIGDGEWHFIVGVLNTGVDAKIYVDGQLENTDTDSIPTSILPSGDLYIGRDGTAEAELRWNGLIDEVRIYNRALSEDEVQTLYDDCEHATYSLKKRTLTVPFVEMPIIDFFTGQSTGEVELWTGTLKQVLGVTNRFRLLSKTVVPITDGSSSSCPATYAVETGTLSIPYIDIPTGIAVGNKNFENGVNVFRATMTWEPMGKSFVVQDVQKLD